MQALTEAKLAVNWRVVDELARLAGIDSDAELARSAGIHQSVVSRARRGVVGPTIVAALVSLFPEADIGRLFTLSDAA